MRSISSAYWLALQGESLAIAEVMDLSAGGSTFRWCTKNETIISSGQYYYPFPGKADGIQESTDLSIGTINFSLANSGGFANQLIAGAAWDYAHLTVYRIFVHSPDLGHMIIFDGTLADFEYSRNIIKGQTRNLLGSTNIQWPYYNYGDTCTWKFGGNGCKFITASLTIVGSLLSGSGFTIGLHTNDISSKAFGFYDHGRLTITTGANSGQARYVRSSSGDTLTISHTFPYPISGTVGYSLFPGCRKRLYDDCTSKYNFAQHFLGFPWIPVLGSQF